MKVKFAKTNIYVMKSYLLSVFLILFFYIGNAIAGEAGLYYVPIEANNTVLLKQEGLQLIGQNIVIKWRFTDKKVLTFSIGGVSSGQPSEFDIDQSSGNLGFFSGRLPNSNKYSYTFKHQSLANGKGWIFTLFRLEDGQDGVSNKHLQWSVLARTGTELYDLADDMTPLAVEKALSVHIPRSDIPNISQPSAVQATSVRDKDPIMTGSCKNENSKDYIFHMKFYENGAAIITRDPYGRFEYKDAKDELVKGKGLQMGYLSFNKDRDITDAFFPRINEMPEITLTRSNPTNILNREVQEKLVIVTGNGNNLPITETLNCNVVVSRKLSAASLGGRTAPEIARMVNANEAKPLSVQDVSAKVGDPVIMSGACKSYPYSKNYLLHMKFYADGIAMITQDPGGRYWYNRKARDTDEYVMVEGKGLRIGHAILDDENNVFVANFPKLGAAPKTSLIRREFKTDDSDKGEQEWWEIANTDINGVTTTEIVQCSVVRFKKAAPSEGKAP